MNWLDFVLIFISIIAIFYVSKTGLFSAILLFIGVIVGWQIAGHYSDDIGEALSSTISSDRTVSVISYIAIIAASIGLAKLASNTIKPLISVATFGLSSIIDKLGGLIIGILLAGFITGAIILGLTRLAYSFELPKFAENEVTSNTAEVLNLTSFDISSSLNKVLIGSNFARTFVQVVENVPANAIGFVPDDFDIAVKLLSQRIE